MDSATTRVSVIVPLYNKRLHILRALQSILAQQCLADEIIVVDDGSTDGSGQLVRAAQIPKLRLIRQENGGPGAARNLGIAEATGDIVAFLDADDCWHPAYLAESVNILTAHREAAAVTSCYIDHPDRICRKAMWEHRGLREGLVRVLPQTPPQLFTHMVAYMHPCTTTIRLNVVRHFEGFVSKDKCRYAEDASLFAKVLLNEQVYFHLSPLVDLHHEASELSTRSCTRPVEPFLLRPIELETWCSPELAPVLRGFLQIRASKTAAILGYWGRWQEAQRLRRRFVTLRDHRVPFFWYGALGATPMAGYVGCFLRAMASFTGWRPGST